MNRAPDDVRMKGFSRRTPVHDAIQWVDAHSSRLPAEAVDLAAAGGRVLAEDVVSEVDVPPFPRAMMDGFAVQAGDTAGATPYNRLPLQIVGTVLPGAPFPGETLRGGQAVRIMTGAKMPPGADTVVPVEQTELSGEEQVLVRETMVPGKHVGAIGEDISHGQVVLTKGRSLRPQDLGVLSSIGHAAIPVYRRPVVRVIVTGNELLPPGSRPTDEQISDANSPMLRALIERDGGIVSHPGILPDDEATIRAAFHEKNADVILVAGGSSVGQEDFAPQILARDGELAIHGIAMRPSSPTGMGVLGATPVFLLPGNPVSCLCAYDFFAGRAIRALGGLPTVWPYPKMTGRLTRKLVSAVGRTDYARVEIQGADVTPLAISGASLLSTTTRADGFAVIAEESEGLAAGCEVDVWCYGDV